MPHQQRWCGPCWQRAHEQQHTPVEQYVQCIYEAITRSLTTAGSMVNVDAPVSRIKNLYGTTGEENGSFSVSAVSPATHHAGACSGIRTDWGQPGSENCGRNARVSSQQSPHAHPTSFPSMSGRTRMCPEDVSCACGGNNASPTIHSPPASSEGRPQAKTGHLSCCRAQPAAP